MYTIIIYIIIHMDMIISYYITAHNVPGLPRRGALQYFPLVCQKLLLC